MSSTNDLVMALFEQTATKVQFIVQYRINEGATQVFVPRRETMRRYRPRTGRPGSALGGGHLRLGEGGGAQKGSAVNPLAPKSTMQSRFVKF